MYGRRPRAPHPYIYYTSNHLQCQVQAYNVLHPHTISRGGIHMKTDKIRLRSSFLAQDTEQLRQAVTKKVAKIANDKLKKAG